MEFEFDVRSFGVELGEVSNPSNYLNTNSNGGHIVDSGANTMALIVGLMIGQIWGL